MDYEQPIRAFGGDFLPDSRTSVSNLWPDYNTDNVDFRYRLVVLLYPPADGNCDPE